MPLTISPWFILALTSVLIRASFVHVMINHLTSRIDNNQSTASSEFHGTSNTTTQATSRHRQHYQPGNISTQSTLPFRQHLDTVGPTMRRDRCSLSPGRTLMTSSSLLLRFLLLASVYNVVGTGNVHTMSQY